MNTIVLGDNLDALPAIDDGAAALIYIDPPFNTGKVQARERLRTVRDEQNGDRVGFQGRRYRTVSLGTSSFPDAFDDFVGFLEPRLAEARRVLAPSGSFFLHVDYRGYTFNYNAIDRVPYMAPGLVGPEAIRVMAKRLAVRRPVCVNFTTEQADAEPTTADAKAAGAKDSSP